jgi:hypothetical protein
MGMMEHSDVDIGVDLRAGVQVTADGMVRESTPRDFVRFFPTVRTHFSPLPKLCNSTIPSPTLPPQQQVSKEDFENAIRSAQEALRAKTSSSQVMLQQASSAMRNAVTALSLSEQEVANLRVVVKELKERPSESGNEVGLWRHFSRERR